MRNSIVLIDDIHFEGRDKKDKVTFLEKIEEVIESIRVTGRHPVVVLAGDIDVGVDGIHWAADISTDVIYVPGNHEYWRGDIYELDNEINKTIELYRYKNIHVLQNKTIIINNIRFIGSTLWTDVASFILWEDINYTLKFFWAMGDFKQIKAKKWYDSLENIYNIKNLLMKHNVADIKIEYIVKNKLFNPLIEREINEKAVNYIKKKLNDSFRGVNCVVTHHLPLLDIWLKEKGLSRENIIPPKINNEIDIMKSFHAKDKSLKESIMLGYYANNLPELINNTVNPPALWLHGHLHIPSQNRLAMTKTISSPVGYGSQSKKLKYEIINIDIEIRKEIIGMVESYDWDMNMMFNLSKLKEELLKRDISRKDIDIMLRVHKENKANLSGQIQYWLRLLHLNTNMKVVDNNEVSIEKEIGLKALNKNKIGCFDNISIPDSEVLLSKQKDELIEKINIMIDYTEKLKIHLKLFIENYAK